MRQLDVNYGLSSAVSCCSAWIPATHGDSIDRMEGVLRAVPLRCYIFPSMRASFAARKELRVLEIGYHFPME